MRFVCGWVAMRLSVNHERVRAPTHGLVSEGGTGDCHCRINANAKAIRYNRSWWRLLGRVVYHMCDPLCERM